MAEKAKSVRLLKAAKELNIGTSTITSFLEDKGFKVDNKPTAKLSEEMYDVLLREFADEKLIKEKAEQVELGKTIKEAAKQVEEDKEAAAVAAAAAAAAAAAKVEVEEPKEEEKVSPKAETLKGPKILGKIDLSATSKKKEKKKEEPLAKTEEPIKEEKPASVAKKEKATAPKKEEKPVVSKEEPKVSAEPAPKKDEVEKHKTSFKSLEGPKIMGKIELPVEQKKKKLVASSSDDASKTKKKRKKIKVNPDKVQGDKKPANTGGGDRRQGGNDRRAPGNDRRKKVNKKEATASMKATLAKMENKKNRKAKRLKKADGEGEEELMEENIVQVTEFSTVSDISALMDVSVTQIITACMNLGVMVSMNQRLDAEIIELVCEEFGFEVKFIDVKEAEEEEEEEEDDPKDLEGRAPIVTIMGHVDHGKTSLLDYIRKENVIAGEAGGITQHIGAYSVTLDEGQEITFLDTPGHEAFTAMRARGAKVTDIAVIVIAADDAIMPQTKEAIAHAQAAGVSMIFAINKIDKDGANPDKIREQLASMDLLVEDWGGKFQCQEISAKKGLNIEELLEKILLEAEMLELKANPNKPGVGTIIEASLDKGKGYVTTLLVQAGTFKVGDCVVAGANYGKVKAISNERGTRIQKAGPSHSAVVLGFSGAPTSGDRFKVYPDENEAKEVANKRAQIIREQGIRTSKHITLDEIGRRLALGNFHELNIIVKADVDGSVEAVCDSLQKLSNDEVQINVIHKGVGQISESDILLASASDALVIAFQVRPSASAKQLAEQENIEIKMYSIIYQAIEEIKLAIEGLLEPTQEEKITANVEIMEIFKVSKVGTIAGCLVQSGKIFRNHNIRIIRDGIVIHDGQLASLKRYKDDIKEVPAGMECGLNIKGFNDIEAGDIVEGYEIVEIKRKL
jgi:translation initiation factor IF-2